MWSAIVLVWKISTSLDTPIYVSNLNVVSNKITPPQICLNMFNTLCLVDGKQITPPPPFIVLMSYSIQINLFLQQQIFPLCVSFELSSELIVHKYFILKYHCNVWIHLINWKELHLYFNQRIFIILYGQITQLKEFIYSSKENVLHLSVACYKGLPCDLSTACYICPLISKVPLAHVYAQCELGPAITAF